MAAGHHAAGHLGGIDLPEGAKLFLWLAAAGRDPRVFPEPDRFDLAKPNADQHLAFGTGSMTTWAPVSAGWRHGLPWRGS